MKKLFTIIVLCVLSLSAFAKQTSKCQFSGGFELTSKYMWRGLECAIGPTVFPTLSFCAGDFSISALGAYAFDSSIREVDLAIGYSFKGLSIGLVDYFYPSREGMSDSYFNWKSKETGHLLEATLSYCFQRIPFYIMWSTMFYGNDYNQNEKQAYSSYFELGYTYDFGKNNEISAILGTSVLKGMYTFYEKGFSAVNIAAKYSKTFDLEVISVPLSVTYIINPYMEKTYLSVSAGFFF